MKPIWMPIAALIWLGTAAFVGYYNWGWWRQPPIGFLPSLLFGIFFGGLILGCFGAVLGLTACGISDLIGRRAETIWRECWRANIASMRNADGIHGSISGGIFMVSGHVDSHEIYYYYTTDGPDRYKPHSWRPDQYTTVIEEDRRNNGEVVQFEIAFANESSYWFGFPDNKLRMDFHIPKGSLVHQYSIK